MYILTNLANDCAVDPGGASPSNDDRSELAVDENVADEDETHEQKLVRWERERHQMIQAGKLRHGILVDFDYATTIQPGQSKPVAVGARTVSINLPIYIPHSSLLVRGRYHLCQPKSFSTIGNPTRRTAPVMT